MSNYDFNQSLKLIKCNPPFYSLLRAAMINADTENTRKLALAWPELWIDNHIRYNVPGAVTSAAEYENIHEDKMKGLKDSERENWLASIEKRATECRERAERRWERITGAVKEGV